MFADMVINFGKNVMMDAHKWIDSVLGDLTDYAERNGLPALGTSLSQCRNVLTVELDSDDTLTTRLSVVRVFGTNGSLN